MNMVDAVDWQQSIKPHSVELSVDQQGIIDKQKIATAFSQAATHYDSAAKLQQYVLDQLAQFLPKVPAAPVIVDLGCGTGKGLQQLEKHYPTAQLLGLDLAYGMLAQARESTQAQTASEHSRASWCCGDGESFPLKTNSIDLVFSSLAIQWCQSFPQVLEQLYQSLKPGGYFVFSTLTKGTLAELRQAWRGVDSYIHVNSYPSVDWHYQQIAQSAFQLTQATNKEVVVCEESLKALLHGIKAIGAGTVNGARRTGLMTCQQYRQLSKHYELFRQSKGLPATYQVLYTVLKKADV